MKVIKNIKLQKTILAILVFIIAGTYLYYHYINLSNEQLTRLYTVIGGIPATEISQYPALYTQSNLFELFFYLLVLLYAIITIIFYAVNKSIISFTLWQVLLISIVTIIHLPMVILLQTDLFGCYRSYVFIIRSIVILLVVVIAIRMLKSKLVK